MAKSKSRKKPTKNKVVKRVPRFVVKDDTDWEISLLKADFNKLKSDKEFFIVLSLARVVNALSFFYQAFEDAKGGTKPVHIRHRMQAFFYSASALYEAIEFANKHLSELSHYSSYKNEFATLLQSKKVVDMMKKDTRFYKIRNRITFHTYPNVDVMKKGLVHTREIDSYDFTIGNGTKNSGLYHGLADDIALDFVIGKKVNAQERDEILNNLRNEVFPTMKDYFTAAQKLIQEVIFKKGWKVKPRKPVEKSS